MKASVLALAAACAALLPVAAGAQPASPASDAMSKSPMMSATMMCRPAAAGEHGNAMMMGASKGELVCRAIPPSAMNKGPDLSKALTVQQADAAWRAFVESMMNVTNAGGG